jgi:epoxyqueuosine reductase QueG
MPREALYDVFACQKNALEMAMAKIGIRLTICGLCIVACPWTKKYLDRAGKQHLIRE